MSSNFFLQYKKTLILNLLFSFIIFSFIIGNLVLNLNVVLLIIVSFIFYKKKIINQNLNNIDKLIIFFFLYILASSFYNNIYYLINGETNNYNIILKSLFYLRFLLLYLVVKFLIKENIINLKYFLVSSLIATIFVSFDLIFQLIYGYDIFGFEADPRRLSGPFGDELVAGSYLQRFGLFALFCIPIFGKFKNLRSTLLITLFLFLLILFSMIIAGNRVPLTFFFLSIFFILLLEKTLRKFLIIFVLVFFGLTFTIFSQSKQMQHHLWGYYEKIGEIIFFLSPKNIISKEELENKYKDNMFYTFEYRGNKYKMTNSYLKEFKTGYVIWSNNKFIGGGLKSLKIACKIANVKNCGIHPHNYYLEILAILGLAGAIIVVFLFGVIFLKIFIKKYFYTSHLNKYHLLTPFIFNFFSEIFPLKSTGSFFTTANSTYIFLILSIMISLSKIEKEEYYKLYG